MDYRTNAKPEEIAIAGPPWTSRAYDAIAGVLKSNAFLWLLLTMPTIFATCYAEGCAAKFYVSRMVFAFACIPAAKLFTRFMQSAF